MISEQFNGAYVRHLREERGLSRNALSYDLRVTTRRIAQWELNDSPPSVPMLARISNYFGVPVESFFKENDREHARA
ncbi:helix-turn-helix domain-containing protein [Streptomyces sp. S1A]|uniref:helix-turn-helix domain-containing protein n=1 Tax=Streptomyces sp. ICN903 TaxID=2964654 RepID=UPI001ED9D222|nr:helix-turn-helix transcriptional regulator [Streptomyces sp. ICN903]MCG3042560.1 helix-turn-helix domain-containing protein [Streptomyces sp. ICN903]